VKAGAALVARCGARGVATAGRALRILVASQSTPSWSQLTAWLRQMETLRKTLVWGV
jgi:hypothetical protein